MTLVPQHAPLASALAPPLPIGTLAAPLPLGAPVPLDTLRCLREWPAMLPSTLQPRLLAWLHAWDALDASRDFRIETSGRMRSSLGRAYLDRRLVRINALLVQPGVEALLEEVLCHEIAHLVVHERHALRARPHGREWRNLLREVGITVRVTIPRKECAFLPPVRRRSNRRRRHRPPGPRAASAYWTGLGGLWSAWTRFQGRLM